MFALRIQHGGSEGGRTFRTWLTANAYHNVGVLAAAAAAAGNRRAGEEEEELGGMRQIQGMTCQ